MERVLQILSGVQLDVFGVPWLGTILIAGVVLFVVIVLAIAIKNTRDQLKGKKPLPNEEPKKDPEPKAKAKRQETPRDEHCTVDAPMTNGRKTFRDRIAPLIFEKTRDGKWKMSLGRTSYWFTMPVFIAMCVLAMVSLDRVDKVGQPLVNLYLGVLGMLFLTNIGLMAYNLGNKFTAPMSMFLMAWGGKYSGGSSDSSSMISAMGEIKDLVSKDKDKSPEADVANQAADEDLNKLDKEPLKEEERPKEKPPKVGEPPPV